MPDSALSGQAQTVLGPIAGEAMGITLPHEHLLIDFAVMFREPAAASDKGLAYQPVGLANVGWVRQNFNANLDNLRLLDEQTALDEITLFKRVGGQTVVDPTNVSLARDPLALTRISRATGLNIVMGAGYYVAAAHPADMDRRSEDAIVREIVREVTVGVGDTGVRAGLIGEIGNTWPWTENEKKVVRAAVDRMPDDSLVERMVPDRGRGHQDASLAQGFGQAFEVLFLVRDHFAAGFLERGRIEKTVAAQVLVVVTDQNFEACARLSREPCGAAQRRLIIDGRIDDR